jgi:hypothetical protein
MAAEGYPIAPSIGAYTGPYSGTREDLDAWTAAIAEEDERQLGTLSDSFRRVMSGQVGGSQNPDVQRVFEALSWLPGRWGELFTAVPQLDQAGRALLEGDGFDSEDASSVLSAISALSHLRQSHSGALNKTTSGMKKNEVTEVVLVVSAIHETYKQIVEEIHQSHGATTPSFVVGILADQIIKYELRRLRPIKVPGGTITFSVDPKKNQLGNLSGTKTYGNDVDVVVRFNRRPIARVELKLHNIPESNQAFMMRVAARNDKSIPHLYVTADRILLVTPSGRLIEL